MHPLLSSLYILPVVVSGLVLILPRSLSKILTVTTAIALTAISVWAFIVVSTPSRFVAAPYVNPIVVTIDVLLLAFFGVVALRYRSWLVGTMTLLQIAISCYLLIHAGSAKPIEFFVDRLSLFMFLLINVISGVICIFSLKYIEDEPCSKLRKRYFLSILFAFIAVMNLLVSCDNLDCFFLLFELTTLASFLLIAFRKDQVSIQNALTALWMNQVGGLAILIAIFFLGRNGIGDPTFSNLLKHNGAAMMLLPLALLSMAALIKGAQMPFSKWLIGAMVAPTPVSALLHSSTMVKIAPFMILRLSPALQNTSIAWVIVALTAFVFTATAIGALGQDNFKRILAHSTIALLALMIMMGALATPVTIIAALTLMLFHGISKCMLFLDAGVIERLFHVKETSDMDKLGETGKFTAFVVTIGFMSLLLPPFGAFIGKWFSIETLGGLATSHKLVVAFVIVMIAFGGAVLSLLYFKVLGLFIVRTGRADTIRFERQSALYTGPILTMLVLVLVLALGFPFLITDCLLPVASQTLGSEIAVEIRRWTIHIGAFSLPLVPMLAAFLLLPAAIVLGLFIRFRNVDRVKEYACGEKLDYSFSALYFPVDMAGRYFTVTGILFFVALLAVVFV